MEITQKNKRENVEYITTIDGVEATCTVVLNDGVKRRANATCSGVTVRKPQDEVMVELSGKRSEMPSNLETLIDSLTTFLEECVAKHE